MTTTATFTKKRHKISEKTNENLDSINRTPSTKNKRFSAFLARYILNIVYTLLLMLTLKLCWFLYWISNLYWILNCIELLNSLHIFVLFLIILFCVKHEMVIVAAMAFQTFQNYKTCCDPNRKKQLLSKKKKKFLNSSPRLRDQGGGLASWTGDPPPQPTETQISFKILSCRVGQIHKTF